MENHRPGHVYRGQTVGGHAQVHNGDQYKITRIEEAPKPKPRSLVPYHRDNDFVGRDEFLVLLDRALENNSSHKRTALTGLGGMGKSQIAIELSWRYSLVHPNHWVFWVFASSRSRFIQSFKEIGYAVGLTSLGSPMQILRDVRTWLADPSNGPWLMIVDNADDFDDFWGPNVAESHDPDDGPLAEYLPQAAHGHILITSRNHQVGEQLAGSAEATFRVSKFDMKTACLLISRKLDNSTIHHCEHTEKLAQSLDCIPLAITQATAYIRAQRPRMDIERYLGLFERSILEQQRLLSSRWADIRRDTSVSNAVLTTWLLSYNHMKKSPSVNQTCSPTRIILLLSLLDRQSIDESLIRPNDVDDIDFGESLAVLHQYAMIDHLPTGAIYQHRLVHIAARIWLEADNDAPSYKNHMSMRLTRALVDVYDGQATWQFAESLLPHLKESASWILSLNIYTDGSTRVAEICEKFANFMGILHRPTESLLWRKRQLETLETTLGSDHWRTLSTFSEYAFELVQVGRLHEARHILHNTSWVSLANIRHIQVLNIALKLGKVASRLGMHKLALDFSLKAMRQSRWRKFEVQYETECWEVEREATEFVASLYVAQGDLLPAEWLLKNLSRRTEARDWPQISEQVSAIKSLILILGEQKGREVEQEALLRRLDLLCTIISRDSSIQSIIAAVAYTEIADGFTSKLRLVTAESLYTKAYKLLFSIHGENTPRLATVAVSLLTVYTLQQNPRLAEHWHARALRLLDLAASHDGTSHNRHRVQALKQWRDSDTEVSTRTQWNEALAKKYLGLLFDFDYRSPRAI